METLGRFGLDPVLFAAQLVNFIVIGYVLWRFLLKPLLATMKKRSEAISKGLADAEQAKRELADAAKESDKIVGEAYTRAAVILDKARAEAVLARAAVEDRARRDAERILVESRSRLELERREAERAVQALALELSGRILEQVVSSLFSGEEKTRIVERGFERIRTLEPTRR